MTAVIGPTLRLSIDARGAKTGARDFTRATDQVRVGGAKASQAANKVGSDFEGLKAQTLALGRALVLLGGGALSVRALARYADEWTTIRNRLRLVTGSAGELADVQGRLFEAAQASRTEFAGLAELYQRVALAATELGTTQDEQIAFSEGVAQALAITGTSATEAAGALRQLAQAIGAGTVRAEEFNSILDATPRIAQAVAAGLEAAGGSVARLRQLVIDGKVSSKDFFRSFETQLPVLRAEFETTESTISQAFTTLDNAALAAVGNLDDATDASNNFAGAIQNIAAGIDTLSSPLAEAIEQLRTWRKEATDAARDLPATLFELLYGPYQSGTGKALATSPELGGRRPGQNVVEPEPYNGLTGTGRGGGGGGDKREKRVRSLIGPARESFRAAQEEDLRAGEEMADRLGISFETARNRATEALQRIREEHAIANDQMAVAIEIRRDREIAALDQLRLREEDLAEARRLINQKYDRQLQETGANLLDLGRLATDFGFVAVSAFEDAILKGEGFSDVLQGLADDITRILLKMAVLGPITQGLGGLGGIVSGLFGGGGGSISGSSGFAGPIGSPRAAGALHTGGIVGTDMGAPRFVHPAVFDDAPRFHTGLMPNEFPAVLERGEGVFTPSQMRALGGAQRAPADVNVTVPIKVDVINQSSGAGATAEQDSNGNVMIKIYDKLAGDIESGRLGLSVDKRVRASFGLSERLVGR